MPTRQRLLIAAAVAALLSAASLGVCVHTVRLSRSTGYTAHVETWAYLQFLLFATFAAAAVVSVLRAFNPASRTVAVLMGLLAAFASVVAMSGLLTLLVILTGHERYAEFAAPIYLTMAAVSTGICWVIARNAGAGRVASWLGAVAALTFIPLLMIGAFVFCSIFMPHIRCM